MAAETLAEAMTSALQKAGLKTQQKELQETYRKNVVMTTGCRDRETFLTTYNPDTQIRLCRDRERYITATHPTLQEINEAYGKRTAKIWLMAQIVDLSEFAGATAKLSGKPLEQCANIIAEEHKHLTIYDIMLFLHDFKAGKFGRFYGSVDALAITEGVWKYKERKRYELARIRMQENDTHDNRKTVSWEEYCMKTYGKIRPLGQPDLKKGEKS